MCVNYTIFIKELDKCINNACIYVAMYFMYITTELAYVY